MRGAYAAPAFSTPEQGHDALDGTAHGDANDLLRAGAESPEMVGDAVRLFVEFAIAQLLATKPYRRVVRVLLGLPLDQFVDAAIRRLCRGFIPGFQHQPPLPGCQEIQPRDFPIRVRDGRFQQPLVVTAAFAVRFQR